MFPFALQVSIDPYRSMDPEDTGTVLNIFIVSKVSTSLSELIENPDSN
jgi:hypothetical protein